MAYILCYCYIVLKYSFACNPPNVYSEMKDKKLLTFEIEASDFGASESMGTMGFQKFP